MAKVDFYIVGEPGEQAMMRIGCRLIEKAWQQGHRVYVLTDSPQRSAMLDDLLWTFRQDSFVPHARGSGSGSQTAAPILIGEEDALPPDMGVLVNLSDRIAHCAAHCERVAELVPADPQARANARERYRHYREQGMELDSHEV